MQDYFNKVTLTLRDAITGEVREVREAYNTVMYGGKLHILDNLRGRTNVQPANTSNTYCAVGTGSTTITVNDVALNTEVAGSGREVVTSISRSNQTVLFSTFFDTGVGNGTLKEAGLFVTGYDSGGTLRTAIGSPKDTGVLWNRVVFANLTKDTSATLTFDFECII